MELSAYVAPLIKWWRLIVVAAVIAGASTLVATLFQPAYYTSRTTLIVGQSINNPNPSSPQFYLEQELAKIYADIGGREPVRRATMEALGLAWLPSYAVRALPNTQLIEIAVTDTNALRAQAVAAELADQLVQRTPADLIPEDEGRQAFVDEQLTQMQQDIVTTQEEITTLQTRLGELSGAREISDVERQISALQDKLRTLQSTYASLVSGTPRGAVNSLTIVEPAEVPARSSGPNRMLNVVLAIVLGAVVAGSGAYLIEYLDRRVNLAAEAQQLLGWPILAEIGQMPAETEPASYIIEQPDTMVADSFRALRASLEAAGLGSHMKTVLVTGPSPAEGKSTVALSLALTMAMAGRRTVLIDGDSHRPQPVYSDRMGLSDLLLNGGNPTAHLINPYPGTLSVLPAGVTPLRAAGLMSLGNVRRILDGLEPAADVIVIDGPPAFVSDSLVLAGAVDGVVAVIRLGHSPRDAVREMKARIESSPANILGVVLNGVAKRPAFYHSYYQSPPSSDSQTPSGTIDKLRDVLKGLGAPGAQSGASMPAYDLRGGWETLRLRVRAAWHARVGRTLKNDESRERVI